MYIKQELCDHCARCRLVCPVGAIYVDKSKKQIVIDQAKCVECGVCYRAGVCKPGGLTRPDLTWPRSVRATFSDPLLVHKETRIPGRGTEEMKTNEVTGRYRRGRIGIALELGRPGISTSFWDVQKVAMACARYGVTFEPKNPVTSLMTDQKQGCINSEVLNERVLSAIVEFEMPLEQVPALLCTLQDVAKEIDTVFSVDAIGLVEEDGSVPVCDVLIGNGFQLSPNGKNNMGLGRPLFDFGGSQT